MSRETEWIVFEKAIEVTASAVRGTMGAQGSQPASYVGEVFREIHRALREASAEMPDRIGTTGFAAQG
ncbi:MAG: hypothetical protein ABI635_03040 [Actinomycetota bacterium]